MNKSDRMAALAAQLGAGAKPESQKDGQPEKRKAIKPAFGNKPRKANVVTAQPSSEEASTQSSTLTAELEKMTIKLRPPIRERLLDESYKRKKSKSANWQIQEIVSEAVNAYLGQK